MSTGKQNEARPALSCNRMVSVRLRFNRENMRILESILEMYTDSEDATIRRIAATAADRVTKALDDGAAR